MKLPKTNIKEISIPEEKQEIEEGKLYFFSACYESGYKASKDIEEVTSSCFGCYDIDSSTFWNDFRTAERVVIIDKFFMNEDLEKVISIFRENKVRLKTFKSFKIFTANANSKKDRLLELSRLLRDEIIFEVYDIQKDFIHDRFAILDKQLFHFGCTVGGKTSEGFSAFSCGWNASRIDTLISELERSGSKSKRINL